MAHDGGVSRTVAPAPDAPIGDASLRFPPDADQRARIPDDATVWAFSDIHGVRSGLLAALVDAGIADVDGAWIAPPGTALVGLGDYIDRGTDSAGVVALLISLRAEAAGAGSWVVLLRGNHEQVLVDVLQGLPGWMAEWLDKGGAATLRSFGLAGTEQAPDRLSETIETAHPELAAFVLDTLPYAVWRDVLLVHAGPPAHVARLEDLGEMDAQMWHATPFTESPGIGLDPGFRGYREAGIRRVALGHVPQPAGPTTIHGGTALLLDTNAASPPKRSGAEWRAYATLVRLGHGPDFDDSETVMIDTSTAPDRASKRKDG